MADHPTVVLFNGPTRLNTLEVAAPTTVGHVLTVTDTSPLAAEWQAGGGGGSGDVVGPGSATDNALVRFDGTTGKLVQNSGATLDDSGNLLAPYLFAGSQDTMTIEGAATTTRLHAHNTSDSGTIAELEVHRIAGTANRGATIYGARAQTGETAVTSGDRLFQLAAVGHDGTDYDIAGRMYCEVNGTVANNQVPGAWVWTTANASGTEAERMRIDSTGLTLATALSVANGGTGSTTASAARTALGVAIGSNVQAWSARLDTIAGLTRNRGDLIVGGSSDWTDLALGTSGYYLKSDGTDAVWAALPTGSSSTAGLVELAAYGEGQTDTATARVPDVRSDWEIYRPGLPYFGSHWAGPNNTVAIGDYGTCDGSAVTGTWNSGRDSNSGLHYAEVATSTGTQRNILWATNGASMSSWSYGDMRFSFLMRVPGGTANVRYFCGLTLFGGSSVMTSVESTVTAHIRFGWDTTSILAICADGTTRTKTTFSTSTTGSTSVYEFEIVPNRGMTSVVFNLYTWTATGGRGALVETATITTNIPSGGSTTIYPGVWALATSGTPNVQWYGTRFMINLT